MAARFLLLASIALSCLVCSSYGVTLFSSLQRSLIVTASHKDTTVLKAGLDDITVTWALNQSFPAGSDATYKTIKVKLCFAPISQVDRAWRKTHDELNKDKTCQFNIVTRPYDSRNKTVQSFKWTVERDLPTGTYFVRAYAYNSDNTEVAYGQNTDGHKSTNLFQVQAISGRHLSMDIASVCFSAFSVISLFGFFYNEKRKGKK